MSKSVNGKNFEDLVREESTKLKFGELLFPEKKCTDCGEKLVEGKNWFKSHKKKQIHLCKECARKRSREDYKKRKELGKLASKIEEDPKLRKKFWKSWLKS